MDMTTATPAVSSGTNDTLLPIVSSQRDRYGIFVSPYSSECVRFRVRNVELEAEARHSQQTITSLRNEIDTLRFGMK